MKKIKKITINDLDILNYSIQIPILTEKIVDESFAYIIERDLNENGFQTQFISLDDFGFISVSFNNLILTEEQVEAVIKYVNKNL